MTKNLLKSIMIKPEPLPEDSFDTTEMIQKIQSGYLEGRGPKHTQKKTFAPSTIAYGHGECPRYWYLAFDGQTFEDNNDAYGVANMTAGTKSHDRIQDAMMASGIAEIYRDADNNPTTEFKITNQDPPIFGYGDAMLNWQDEQIVGEIEDEFDIAEDDGDIFGLGDRTYRVSGDTAIDRVEEAFETTIFTPDEAEPQENRFDTIGGFIFGMLGHVPVQGESVDFDGWRISTETLDGRRIQQVRISAITP